MLLVHRSSASCTCSPPVHHPALSSASLQALHNLAIRFVVREPSLHGYREGIRNLITGMITKTKGTLSKFKASISQNRTPHSARS
ncbi:hypothetical protein BRADI_4g05876v3 [Brachypodium distachyon]|uniref:Uncharacterized protein n=1 Tax=Brachypodium distachyon TaxID=15368 RepID=A0A2K2CKR3_BRADI|nr:hypothetical protein BRADI_4g05876v3 [Brachypodium distachyon]